VRAPEEDAVSRLWLQQGLDSATRKILARAQNHTGLEKI